MQSNTSSIPQPRTGTTEFPAVGAPFNFSRILSGVFIPVAILECRELSPGARLLWGVLRGFTRKTGQTWVGDQALAARLHVSVRQVRRYGQRLERAGLLRATMRPGKSPIRELLWAAIFQPQIQPTGWTHPSGGVDTSGQGGGQIRPPNIKNNKSNESSSSSILSTQVEAQATEARQDDDEPTELKCYPTRLERVIAAQFWHLMAAWPQTGLTKRISKILIERKADPFNYTAEMAEVCRNLRDQPKTGIWIVTAESQPKASDIRQLHKYGIRE